MITEHAASTVSLAGPISLPRGRLAFCRTLLIASPYPLWQKERVECVQYL